MTKIKKLVLHYWGFISIVFMTVLMIIYTNITQKQVSAYIQLSSKPTTQAVEAVPISTPVVTQEETQIYVPVEIDVLSRVVFSEAGNQSYKGKVLVAATIYNRSQRTGMTPYEVVCQPGQYATPRELSTITTPQEIKALEECRQAVIEVFNSNDTYNGIEYFCNPRISNKASLKWFKDNLTLVIIEGEHNFYKAKEGKYNAKS